MWTPTYSNMNFPSWLAAAGFLAAVAGLAVSTLAILVSLFLRKRRFAQIVGSLVAAAAVVYFGLLFGFSWGSSEHDLAAGEEKYFCEIDCHLAYSVISVSKQATAEGERYSVLLRTRFDETTISPQRPREAPNFPNQRDARLVDSAGHQYLLRTSSGTPLTTPIRPGEFYTTTLEFDTPASASGLRLLLTSPGGPEAVIIGDENSLGHRKTYFRL
jgi:hypothetical protein